MKKFNLFAIMGLSFFVMSPSEISTSKGDGQDGSQKGPCTTESAKMAPGKWTVAAFNSLPDNPAVPAIVRNLEKEAEILHRALGEPVGFDARGYFRVPGNPFTQKSPQPLEVNVPFYSYYCDEGKVAAEEEYSGGVMIHTNSTWPMGDLKGIKIGAKTFRMLGSPIGEIRGYPAFEADWKSNPDGANFTWAVLVSKKGMSPFRYATRTEILDHLVQIVEKKHPENQALLDQYTLIRPEEVQAAEKQKELASFLDGARDDATRKSRTERFNKDYRTDQQKLEEMKKKSTGISDKVAANLAAVRARYTPEQLKEPGYVYPWLLNYNTEFNEEDFDFTLPKNDPYCRPADYTNCPNMGKPLAIFKGEYFDRDLPSTSPQYFTVAFSWTAIKADKFRNEESEKLRDEFFARFDFDQLVSLLGK